MTTPVLQFISPPFPFFIDCGQASYTPGERHISRANLDVFDLIAVDKGALSIGEDGREWVIEEGEIIVLRPNGRHYGTAPCTADTEITWIHFQTVGSWQEKPSFEDCLLGQSSLIDEHKGLTGLHHCETTPVFIPKITASTPKIRESIGEFALLEQEPQSLRNWKRQSVFQTLLQLFDRELAHTADTAAIRVAESIEGYIRRHYRLPINNKLLSREFNYHANYLARCMIKVYGMTPLEYLLQYRCEQAKKLLLQTSWTITRIAEEAGFNSPAYFSSAFVHKEGITPGTFRRKFSILP